VAPQLILKRFAQDPKCAEELWWLDEVSAQREISLTTACTSGAAWRGLETDQRTLGLAGTGLSIVAPKSAKYPRNAGSYKRNPARLSTPFAPLTSRQPPVGRQHRLADPLKHVNF
jgi:hypothetical protein